ncbi:predicted protein [Scheffersomyces stipitis CBS 6054]|uniref:CHY-type domain-containing protein n=1 Tax=Scheffersomyces stipitis (strain ATCC 58785 / CBS 6054 / NBRC 10063 / NRRL Y-11545) TaxID=322104 RepID=A3LPH4_PICST|nr:predicted protein [Scheffersomyces stipitis CBS 6054]ABN64492.1 predicted protein [Scheffersomyces stipitis CBS 6054]KAG2736246.1 hypothetical protein G9P44_000336 [Scheffersomyces stipitis]
MTEKVIATEQIVGDGVCLRGQLVDEATRCSHYYSDVDVIAIKFRCCRTYYPCYKCHEELAGHEIQRWARAELEEAKTPVILCGQCHREWNFMEYAASPEMKCQHCGVQFNPKCSLHYDIYFDI